MIFNNNHLTPKYKKLLAALRYLVRKSKRDTDVATMSNTSQSVLNDMLSGDYDPKLSEFINVLDAVNKLSSSSFRLDLVNIPTNVNGAVSLFYTFQVACHGVTYIIEAFNLTHAEKIATRINYKYAKKLECLSENGDYTPNVLGWQPLSYAVLAKKNSVFRELAVHYLDGSIDTVNPTAIIHSPKEIEIYEP